MERGFKREREREVKKRWRDMRGRCSDVAMSMMALMCKVGQRAEEGR